MQTDIRLCFCAVDSGLKSWSKRVSNAEEATDVITDVVKSTFLSSSGVEYSAVTLEHRCKGARIRFTVSVSRSGPLCNICSLSIFVVYEKDETSTMKKELKFRYEADSDTVLKVETIISSVISIIFGRTEDMWEVNKLDIAQLML